MYLYSIILLSNFYHFVQASKTLMLIGNLTNDCNNDLNLCTIVSKEYKTSLTTFLMYRKLALIKSGAKQLIQQTPAVKLSCEE